MTFGVISESSFWLLYNKWNNVKRDFQVGDIVLLKDSTTCNHWPMAKITGAYKGNDGHVQTVKI